MRKRFSQNQYDFMRMEKYWFTSQCWYYSDLCRLMDYLHSEGIPFESMHIESFPWDNKGYRRLVIDFSADEQIEAFCVRQHEKWLAEKAVRDEQFRKQREIALANQETWKDIEWL